MNELRLTRRGRLVLHTLPLFLVTATAVNVLAQRTSASHDALRARPAVASPTATPTATPRHTTAPTRGPVVAKPSPRATASPSTVRTAKPRPSYTGTGSLVVVPGTSAVHGAGPLRRFTVEVEAGLANDPQAFARAVENVLFDPRGWGAAGRMSFQRVSSGPVSFRVTLASPRTTDRLCRPLDTGGLYSCWNGARAVLNAMRWNDGAAAYRGDLPSYRTYMVNHEVGHGLGHGHRLSCGPGGLAPVMMQQTKSLYGCRRNVWPLAGER